MVYNMNNNNNVNNNNNNNNNNMMNNNNQMLNFEIDKNFFKLNQLEVSCLQNNYNIATDYMQKFYSDIKKVEHNRIELNESNSKNFGHIKDRFLQIEYRY